MIVPRSGYKYEDIVIMQMQEAHQKSFCALPESVINGYEKSEGVHNMIRPRKHEKRKDPSGLTRNFIFGMSINGSPWHTFGKM